VASANAWLREVGGNLHVAIGERELVHVADIPNTLFEIPRAPAHCRKLMIWQGNVVPLLDLALRLPEADAPSRAAKISGSAIITGYNPAPGVTAYGAIFHRGTPTRALVDDNQAAPLPARPLEWRTLAHSCFHDANKGPVPILNLARIFLQTPSPVAPVSNPSLMPPH